MEIVLTRQFEQKFYNDTDILQRYLAINGLKNAVEEFNALTTSFNYTLKAETTNFSRYKIEQVSDNSKNKIHLYIKDVPNLQEAGLTTITAYENGEITKSNISIVKEAVFGYWREYLSTEKMYSPENSIFSAVLKHELVHTIGFKDIYEMNDNNLSIMFWQIDSDYNIRTYTEYDKSKVAEYENIIFNTKTNETTNEIEKERI